MMKQWFSASELTACRAPGLPTGRQGASDWIARIATTNPELTRKRAGRGGGLEVHISALPDAAQAALAQVSKPTLPSIAAAEAHAAAREDDKRQMLVRGSADLTARQRLVMEARQTLLLAIDAQAAVSGTGRDRAIRTLATASAAGTLDAAQQALVSRANDRSGTRTTISRPTLYRWFRAREERGMIALAPETTRDKQDLPPWFDDFLAFRQKYSQPSNASALRAYCRTLPAGAPQPTERQVRDALKKLPLLERLKGRVGKLALRTRQAYVARDFSDLLPTSVYSGDGKTFDAEIAHPIHGQPFRPELTTIIDVATRFAVGWSAALDESAHAVTDALRQACTPADGRYGGIPAIFYTDRGSGYVNEAMNAPLTGLLSRLGTTHMKALPYNSQAKGVVERLNQIYTSTAKDLPTYIGKDMDKEAKLVAFKTTRRELALTGTSRLLPSWQEFLEKIQQTIDLYNDQPHSGLPKIRDPQLGRLRHMSPRELWDLKCQNFEPIIPDAAEANELFRPWVVRRTRRALVEWLGNSYFAPALEALDGEDVIVGYDIRDASRVYVRAIDVVDGERHPGRLIAIAAFEGHRTRYVPLSAEQAAIERRNRGRLGRLQKKVDVVGQELRPAALLDLTASPSRMSPAFPSAGVLRPAGPPDVAMTASGAAETVLPASAAAPSATVVALPGGRPVFRDDVSFAHWLAGNPEAATPSDIALLTELLTTPSTKELLRMSGVDLEALRSLARSSRTAGAA
jgi:putative transposase